MCSAYQVHDGREYTLRRSKDFHRGARSDIANYLDRLQRTGQSRVDVVTLGAKLLKLFILQIQNLLQVVHRLHRRREVVIEGSVGGVGIPLRRVGDNGGESSLHGR